MALHELSITSEPLNRANNWLDEHGVVPFTHESSVQIFLKTCEEIRDREARNSLLQPGEDGRLLPGSNALVFEIGGSKNRCNIVTAVSDSHAQTVKNINDYPLGIELPFQRRNFRNPWDFFGFIIDQSSPAVSQIIERFSVQGIAVIYSFDGSPFATSRGIDVQPTATMGKRFTVPDIASYPIGENMLGMLKEKGFAIAEDLSVIVTNDVTAGMINHRRAHLSLIDGTGFNIGIATPDERGMFWIHNTESGSCNQFPLSRIEEAINRESEEPGVKGAETIAGGIHIGTQLHRLISLIHREGILPFKPIEVLTAAHVTQILNDNRPAFRNIFEDFNERDDTSWQILTGIAMRLRARIAVAIGIPLAAQIVTHADSFANSHILCTTEGSTFQLTPELSGMVAQIVASFAPSYQLQFVPASGTAGAGFAVLRHYASRQA